MKKFLLLSTIAIVSVGAAIAINRSGPMAAETSTPSITPTPQVTPEPTPKKTAKPTLVSQEIILNVPFTSQAPFGNWSDPKEENGCEEASALMAMSWVNNTSLTPTTALNQITDISDYEEATYGQYIDTSAADTVTRIFQGYFKYSGASVVDGITAKDIIAQLQEGHVVIVPVNGQTIGNPHYKAPGPLEHMILIKGYDPATDEFITNDSGTRLGESYRYSTSDLFDSIRNYSTEGNHQHNSDDQKVMIVVAKPA